MKNVLIVAIALVSGVAFARPDTTNMTCRDAAGLVADAGAIVLSTGKPYLYERFVANQSFCGGSERTVTAYVSTLDNDSCNIGYVCEQNERGGNSISKKFPAAISVCKAGTYGQARASDYYPNQYAGVDKVPNITVVCNNAGKWVPANDLGWKLPKTVGGKCKDGTINWYPSQPSGRDSNPFAVKTVCKDGKWIKVRW